MTRLSADAYVIPCDSYLNVSGFWRQLLEPGAPAEEAHVWFRPAGTRLDEDGTALVVAEPTTADEATHATVGNVRVLVDTVDVVGPAQIAAMVTRCLAGVRRAAVVADRRAGRACPLVAMPIPGVGQGSFPGRKAEVVRELVRQLLGFTATHAIDVAVVARSDSDIAALQWERHRQQSREQEQDCWPTLSAEHKELADRLGTMAARRELSVFIGAGVSRPMGFPDWATLLRDLGAPDTAIGPETDYPRLAEELGRDDLDDEIVRRFTTDRHALGHALILNLRTPSLVTTNYDPCLENAADVIHVDPGMRVIARELAGGGSPWLLKLHGDIRHRETIVLTRSQYDRLATDHQALRGVVQTLMLTNHLLFLGFGFADSDFLAMSEAVQRVRALARSASPSDTVGTAVQLCRGPSVRTDVLDHRHMRTDGDHTLAARDLEILLDHISWRCQITGAGRAGYLLDPDYEQEAHDHDRELLRRLTLLMSEQDTWSDSSGAAAVRELVHGLGWRKPR